MVRAFVLAILSQQGLVCAQELAKPMPSWQELEAAGAKIGQIHIQSRDIFDTDDPEENYLLFRWANALHVHTRPSVIERALLFKTGDALSVRLIEETERLLLRNRYLYEVQFRPSAYHDGVVDIDVVTRDTWTINLGIRAGRAGGANSSGFDLKEYNLLGTGVAVGLNRTSTVDRSGNEFFFSNEHVFGTWTAVNFSHTANSDGRRDAASVISPFYALDTRWSAGVSAAKDDRIDAVYNAGEVVSRYRRRQDGGEVFGGWSPGLEDGWVKRFSLGMSYRDDAYAPEPGLAAPTQLPADEKLVGPFVRFELIEDRFEKELNRNLIGRPEFFALGLATSAQLGWASTSLGSSYDALLYSGSVSGGFEPAPHHTLIASAAISGQIAGGQVRHQRVNAQAQYYLPQTQRRLFYASASVDTLTSPNPTDALMLGGDNGLRGYPLRYQSGTRRALFTVEQRFYSDWYVWRLFRIGAAAFFDAGRAWGGDSVNVANPGVLSDAGLGLRIVSTRSAFSNVLHLDVAFPLNATGDIKSVQFLFKVKASF